MLSLNEVLNLLTHLVLLQWLIRLPAQVCDGLIVFNLIFRVQSDQSLVIRYSLMLIVGLLG
jgi:hypothetical protein